MAEAEPSRSIVTLDVAKSNRSTCKATGEKIEKGEHRVGVEAYSGGHISMTWQKVVPFLEGCSLEYSKTNTGADKKTGQKFSKGDLRFVMTVKGSRVLLSVKSAAEELKPVLAEANGFSLLSLKGLEILQEGDREEYFNQFGVSKSDAKAYNKEHPPPAEQPASPPPAKKRKTTKAKAVKDEDSEEDQERASEEEEEHEEAADHAETACEQPKIGKKAVVRPSSSPPSASTSAPAEDKPRDPASKSTAPDDSPGKTIKAKNSSAKKFSKIKQKTDSQGGLV